MSNMFDDDDFVDGAYNEEEADYWFTICAVAELAERYGFLKVIDDVNQRRFQKYGSGHGDVPIAGPSGDQGTK